MAKKKPQKSKKKVIKKKSVKKPTRKVQKKGAKKVVKKPRRVKSGSRPKASGKSKKVLRKKITSKKKPVSKSKSLPKKPVEKPIGVVVHWFDHIKVAVVKLKVPLKIGTAITVRRGDMEFSDTVSSMQFNHAPITSGAKGQEVAIKLKKVAKAGAEIFAVK